MTELTDDQIVKIAHQTQTAEPGRDGYVLPISFARAILAASQASTAPAGVTKLRELRDTQGTACDCVGDPYFRGLYNGMELALAVLEDRDPVYKMPIRAAGEGTNANSPDEHTDHPLRHYDRTCPACNSLHLGLSEGKE